MRIHFCTFGSKEWSQALVRIERQAKESGYFTDIHIYNEDNVPGLEDHAEFIQNNKRGYGYWIWKPLVILDVMSNASPGDIIVYADSGSDIVTGAAQAQRFKEIVSDVINSSTHRVAYQTPYLEIQWTKRDVFNHFGPHDPKLQQLGGSPQFLMVTDENEHVMREWLRTMTLDNYHLVDDSPSVNPNDITFGGHRHDQSVLSFIYRRYGFYPETHDKSRDPILASRNKF
jgi:hypothetical protein